MPPHATAATTEAAFREEEEVEVMEMFQVLRADIKDSKEELKQQITATEDRIVAYVNTRIDALDKRIDGVDKSLNTRIDGVEKRIDGVDKRIDGVEKRIDRVDRRISELRQEILATRIFKNGRLALAVTCIVGIAIVGTFAIQLWEAVLN